MKKRLKTFWTIVAATMFLMQPANSQAQTQTLTVYDGTRTSDYVPATISLFAYLTKSQFIIPADDLMEMAGGTISRMKFYTVMSSFFPYTSDCDVDVYLTEVDYTTFDHDNLQLEPTDNATLVYRDALQIVKTDNGGELTIQFYRPYQYKGGNLLVSMENKANAEMRNIYFYGKMVPDASCTVYGRHSGSYFSSFWPNFIPKTTFTYTPSTCGLPPTLTAENITAHEATLAWAGGSGTYNLEIKAEGGEWTPVLTETNQSTHTLTNLAENSDYRARVRSVCGDEMSGWGSVSFSTPYACPPPTDLTVTLTEGNGTVATLSWTENGEATEWQICLNNDEDNLILANSNPFTLTGLSPGTAYTAKVRAYCNSTDQSIWSNTVAFTTHYLLTVFDGTKTDTHVPLYCLVLPYNYTKSQFVIPAGDLSAMAGGTISSMKFYTTAQNIPYTSDCNVDVFVKEVDYTTFPTYPNAAFPVPILEEKTSATIVCQGTLQIVETGNGGELTISFSQPYPYAGGNLLVGMENTEKGSSRTIISFYGTEVTGGAGIIYNYNDFNPPVSLDFIPKTTFVYTPAPQYIALHDNGDNSEIINEKAGTTTGVLLDGRTLYRDGRWNTLCLPFSLASLAGTPLEGATVKQLVSSGYNASTGTLTLNFSTVSEIEAGKPYIVRWGGGDDDIDSPMFNDVTISSLPAGVTETQYTDFIGSYSTVSIAGENRTLLYMGGNSKLYYPNGAMNINAFRGYFRLKNGLTAGDLPTNGAKAIVLNFGDETTKLEPTPDPSRREESDDYYSIDGRKLNAEPKQKGVYIKNGRKIVK